MLFVYGTLQDPDVLGAVLGKPVDAATLQPAVAPGFRAVAYPGRVYPALVPAPGGMAEGRIVEGLDARDLAVLDAFEADEYRRGKLEVLIAQQRHEVDAYLPVIAISAGGPAWSLADWTARHKQAVIGSETATASALRKRLSAQVPD